MMEDIIKIAARANRVATKNAKTFGVSEEHMRHAVGALIQVALDSAGKEPAEVQDLIHLLIETEDESGVPWATSFRSAFRNTVVKKAYEKALAVGVDPVTVVMADCGLTKERAATQVQELRGTAPF